MTDFSALAVNVFAGHFTTGVLEAGATVIGAVEDGSFGVETVLQNYPEIPVWTNREEWPIQKIRELNVDLVYGNPACAGLSMSSSTRGVDSPMNQGLIKAQVFGYSVLPKAFVVESVPQLFTDGIPLVEDWEEHWQALGYNTCRLSENSGHVGLAQNRKRALFIAAKANLDFFYPEHLEAATVREAISDLEGAPLEREFTYPRPPQSAYQERLRGNLTKGTWNEPQKMSKATASLLPYAAQGVRLRNLPDEIYEKSYWLHTRSTARGKLSFLCRRLAWDAPCSVVTGGPTYIHPEEDRFLTIREQSRMMGIPDTFTFSNPRTAYAEIGKAVSPFVGRWITNQLMGILADPEGRTHYPIVDLNARSKALH